MAHRQRTGVTTATQSILTNDPDFLRVLVGRVVQAMLEADAAQRAQRRPKGLSHLKSPLPYFLQLDAHAADDSCVLLLVYGDQQRKTASRRELYGEGGDETTLQGAYRLRNNGESAPKPDAIALVNML